MSNAKKNKRSEQEFIDDGRTIADMDVPGMRQSIWNRADVFFNSEMASKKAPKRLDGEVPWTRKEMFYYYLGSVAATLLYGLVIFGGIALFLILWLKR